MKPRLACHALWQLTHGIFDNTRNYSAAVFSKEQHRIRKKRKKREYITLLCHYAKDAARFWKTRSKIKINFVSSTARAWSGHREKFYYFKQKQGLSNMHILAKITMSMGYDFTKKCNIFVRTKKSFFPPVGRTNIGPIAVIAVELTDKCFSVLWGCKQGACVLTMQKWPLDSFADSYCFPGLHLCIIQMECLWRGRV